MSAPIKFIRKCERYGETNYDVLYETNRLYTYLRLPKTARAFIEQAEAKEQFDKYHGKEIIYTSKGV